MGASSSVSRTRPSKNPSKIYPNPESLSTASSAAKRPQPKSFAFPANNEEDYKEALQLQQENPEMMEVFTGMHEFVETLHSSTDNEWNWTDLQSMLESCLEDAYFTFYRKKLVLGKYLALLKAAGPMSKAYGAAMKEGKLEAFTAKAIENYQPDSVLGFLISLRAVLLNYTDSSYLFCERVSDSDFFKYFVLDMKEGSKNLEDFDGTPDDCFISSVGTLYNCSRNPVTRQNLRQCDTVEALLPFLKCKSEKVRVLVLIALANMLDDDQNDLLLADDSVFDFLIFILRTANATNTRRYDGLSVEEVIDGMTALGKNDQNKSLLVQKGVLPHLIAVMRDRTNSDEVGRAVKCVWELSFNKKNKEEFNNNKELLDLLKGLKLSKDPQTAKSAAGALWVLQMKEKEENKKSEALVRTYGHVMISYQWGDQKTMLQVKECLREHEYNVWMDIDNMGGSTLQAMAEAVQNAAVVLVCMSERYKESQNCRSEAEYAFSLQKVIVPILMQRDYKPDGWLGMIKGTKLFFDLSGKYDFQKKVNELIRELGDKGKGMQADETDGDIQPMAAPVVKAGPPDAKGGQSGIALWTNKDVNNWLVQTDLQRHSSLKSLTGEDLIFLKKLSYKAPEFFYSYVKNELQMKDLKDIRRFTEAVEKMN